jgi:benzylsuccinate CoA-transferase BbsF subunit
MKRQPLSGVRILDFTIVVAGPVSTSVLSELGAEVIKIENTRPRPHNDQDRWGRVHDLNRGKLGITLNLDVPAAREVVHRLVPVCDVVIDNFSPRVMRHWGLDHAAMLALNPRVIAVSMPAFGLTGPRRDMISFGPGIDALSGLAHLTGYPDSMPLKPGNYFCDYSAGMYAALAVMSGLYHRRRTGEGQSIEVAMRDGETQLLGEAVLDYALNGRVQQRMANKHPLHAPHNVYRCKGNDRWLAVVAETDADWAALCGVIGRPELATDPSFATAAARKQDEARVDAIVSAWTEGRENIAAMHALQAAGVPAGAVHNAADLASDPQFQHRGAFAPVELADGRTFRLLRPGWTGRHAGPRTRRGPAQSEHTERVLRDLLGMTDAEIEALVEAGAIARPEAYAVMP